MPKTLLAVDDSATMRKVLEITFAGEDFRVVSAEGPSGALSGLGEHPVAAVIDTSLADEDGYALAKELRARDGGLAVVLMASRYSPYDPNRARDAGVDDFIDKPFDTQALIDKVKKALMARDTSRPAQVAPAAAVTPSPATLSFGSGGGGPPRPHPAAPPPAVGGAAPDFSRIGVLEITHVAEAGVEHPAHQHTVVRSASVDDRPGGRCASPHFDADGPFRQPCWQPSERRGSTRRPGWGARPRGIHPRPSPAAGGRTTGRCHVPLVRDRVLGHEWPAGRPAR